MPFAQKQPLLALADARLHERAGFWYTGHWQGAALTRDGRGLGKRQGGKGAEQQQAFYTARLEGECVDYKDDGCCSTEGKNIIFH